MRNRTGSSAQRSDFADLFAQRERPVPPSGPAACEPSHDGDKEMTGCTDGSGPLLVDQPDRTMADIDQALCAYGS